MSITTGKKGALLVKKYTLTEPSGSSLKVIPSLDGTWYQAAYITDWSMKITKSTFDDTPFPDQQSYTDEAGAYGDAGSTYYDVHFTWGKNLIDKVMWSGSASAYYDISNTEQYPAQKMLQDALLSCNNYTSRLKLQLFINYVTKDGCAPRYYEGEVLVTDASVKAASDNIVTVDFDFEGYGAVEYKEGS